MQRFSLGAMLRSVSAPCGGQENTSQMYGIVVVFVVHLFIVAVFALVLLVVVVIESW